MASVQTYDTNLIDLIERFQTEKDCRGYLEALRWPNGVACIRCGSVSISRITTRDVYECNSCQYQFTVTTGTIMHDSHLPLRKWFMALYLIVDAKKGVSARQMGRMLKVAYRTAWYLNHRIREALATPESLLSGIIEVDETWVGGKTEGKGRGFRGNKTIVVGAIERDGKAVLKVAPDASKATLHGFIKANIADDAEAIHTDEWPAYKGIADENTRHETVNHSQDEWVRGDVHTNTVEGVWALFKRGVIGSFHKISRKHLERYLDEFEWRFNNRRNPFIFRDSLRELVGASPIRYSELIAD